MVLVQGAGEYTLFKMLLSLAGSPPCSALQCHAGTNTHKRGEEIMAQPLHRQQMYIFLLDFRSVPLLPTGWECYESAQVRSWSLVSLRSHNVKPPQRRCVDGAVHFISAD